MAKSPIARVAHSVERSAERVNSALFETTIRLGVTGLSRSGKTIFITSLIENLLQRDRMLRLTASPRISASFLQPQPDKTVPRFPFEDHLSTLVGNNPEWPVSTRSIGQLRLSLRVQSGGLFSMFRGLRTVHIDIVDYPGEWLLDLPLLDLDFSQWSEGAIRAAKERGASAHPFLELLDSIDATAPFDQATTVELSGLFTEYLRVARQAGYSALAPGRFLMPGDMEGAPVMAFAPMSGDTGPRGSLYREMEKRFEAYKAQVVLPFFRDHFAKLDRQVVLLDVLDALDRGPAALGDMQAALSDILESFRVGGNTILSRLFAPRIDRILFAATKADHIHHTQHGALDRLVQAIVRRAKDRAQYTGAETHSMALASFRSTIEAARTHDGATLDMVEGRLAPDGKSGASYPGDLPDDPAALLSDAHNGLKEWQDWSFKLNRFLPPVSGGQARGGLPHIRLDEAAEFLLGDRL